MHIVNRTYPDFNHKFQIENFYFHIVMAEPPG